jgi:hypothetical protein
MHTFFRINRSALHFQDSRPEIVRPELVLNGAVRPAIPPRTEAGRTPFR